MNNFAGAQTKQRVANSHSPSGLNSGGSQTSKDSKSVKLKKGIKVVQPNPGKSPYLNNHFVKALGGDISKLNAETLSQNSSSKASRKGTQSADISDSSLIVYQKGQTPSISNDQQTTQTISNTSVQPLDNSANNMKIIAALQRMKSNNQQTPQQVTVQKSTTSAQSGKNMKVVSLQNQVHKKNAKSLNPNQVHVPSKSPAMAQAYANQMDLIDNLHQQKSESSSISSVIKQGPIKQHSNSLTDSANTAATVLRTDFNNSGNLSGCLKQGQPKISTKSRKEDAISKESPMMGGQQIPSKQKSG